MNRITAALTPLLASKEKALAAFLTAGFPSLELTLPLLLALEEGGADVVELGMPFSDPLADGPIIQQTSTVAVGNGATLAWILDTVQEFRKRSDIPLVLMGYLNPILRYGESRFFAEALAAGVDGVILPEVPLEESGRFQSVVSAAGLQNIMLVAPTTPDDRVCEIDREASGFVYCVSSTGVTGKDISSRAKEVVRRIRPLVSNNPLLVGFGVANPRLASTLANEADGVVVGTAFLRSLIADPRPHLLTQLVQEFKQAI